MAYLFKVKVKGREFYSSTYKSKKEAEKSAIKFEELAHDLHYQNKPLYRKVMRTNRYVPVEVVKK